MRCRISGLRSRELFVLWPSRQHRSILWPFACPWRCGQQSTPLRWNRVGPLGVPVTLGECGPQSRWQGAACPARHARLRRGTDFDAAPSMFLTQCPPSDPMHRRSGGRHAADRQAAEDMVARHQRSNHSMDAAPEGWVSRHVKPRHLTSVLIEWSRVGHSVAFKTTSPYRSTAFGGSKSCSTSSGVQMFG
jgi:hypothetical protein